MNYITQAAEKLGEARESLNQGVGNLGGLGRLLTTDVKDLARPVVGLTLAAALQACTVTGGKFQEKPVEDYGRLAVPQAEEQATLYRSLAAAERAGKLTYNREACDQEVLAGYQRGESALAVLSQLGYDALLLCGIHEITKSSGEKVFCNIPLGAVGGASGPDIVGSGSGSPTGRLLPGC